MKKYTLLNYSFIFSDHFSVVSDQAKLLYIEMMFFAENGFVANPKAILDARNYHISVLNELVANGDVLKLPNRSEVFITAFFLHNKGAYPYTWRSTPYFIYWKDHLHIKKNGVATLKNIAPEDTLDLIIQPKEKKTKPYEVITDTELDGILDSIEVMKGNDKHGIS